MNTMEVPYETVNVLEDERIRTGMKEYSQWPTFPQVYIDGEFFGGCDIMIGMLAFGWVCWVDMTFGSAVTQSRTRMGS
jgi:glutaredoxin-related protein